VTAWERRLQVLLIGVVVISLATHYVTTSLPSTGEPTAPPRSPAPFDFTGPTPRIAIVYDLGGRGSGGFNELAWNGAKRAAAAFSADLKEVTAEPDDTDADREHRLTELAEADYDPIFVIGAAYAPAVRRVAPKYPSIWFGLLDEGSVDGRNVIGIRFSEEQGSFLVGAAAALTSKSGKVGFVGAVRTPLLQKYEAGFAAGVRAANPKVKVQVTYLGDPSTAREAALAMFDAGADVIFGTVGDAGDGVLQAAHERGRWAIGVDSDRYLASNPTLRGAILTSMLKRSDAATYTITMEVANGVPKDGNNVFGLDQGGVGYSTSGGFVDSIRGQLDAFAARIAAGEILVPRKP
jgi:basic membrane protein A